MKRQNSRFSDALAKRVPWNKLLSDASYFTNAERAELALTEAVTRLSDRADPVPDDTWEEAGGRLTTESTGARESNSSWFL